MHPVLFRVPFIDAPVYGYGVMLVLGFDHCEDFDPGVATTLRSVRVHFRVLGVPRVAVLDLPAGIYVESPPDIACPARSPAN